MRTTLEIEDDLMPPLKELAKQNGVSLGRAVSDLIRKSLPAPTGGKVRNGFRVFERRPGEPPVTMEFVKSLLEDEF